VIVAVAIAVVMVAAVLAVADSDVVVTVIGGRGGREVKVAPQRVVVIIFVPAAR
jgi:hypothetical protein